MRSKRRGNTMDFYMKLPRNKREFALFLGVITIVSVHIIAPLITCFEMGFHLSVLRNTLARIPFVWLAVVALVLFTYKPAEWLTHRIVNCGYSFRSVVTINILCTVFILSIFSRLSERGLAAGRSAWNRLPLSFTSGHKTSAFLLV